MFAGDLFIARGSLYFFPEIDLEEQRKKVSGHVSNEFTLLLRAFKFAGQQVAAYTSHTDFWQDNLPPEIFQNEAAAYIYKLKLERLDETFSPTLPLPTYVRAGEISGIRLTPTGVLSFTAQSDTHDFKIGVLRKKRLRNALREAGLGRV
jgi:hypothetical protein